MCTGNYNNGEDCHHGSHFMVPGAEIPAEHERERDRGAQNYVKGKIASQDM